MKCAVLFDGAGLARLGLEQSGLECTGFEADTVAVALGQSVGSGNVRLADATKVDLTSFEAVWASPPCQWHSVARTQGDPHSQFADDLLRWALGISTRWLWVENVYRPGAKWGSLWNAAQFTPIPMQNRNRIIGGRYVSPYTYRPYRRCYPGAIPAILATEHKGGMDDPRRASRHFGRCTSLEECAHYQGFEIPLDWCLHSKAVQYEAIGNGVPVYMAKAFGEALMERS